MFRLVEVQLLNGVTPREYVRQPTFFSCWPRWCAQAHLESTGFSLTELSYGFMFSSSLFLFTSLPTDQHHQVALPPHREGREGEQPHVSRVREMWFVSWGCSGSSMICSFPRGGSAHHLCNVLNLCQPQAWDESNREESTRAVPVSGGKAEDVLWVIPFPLDPRFPKQ